MEDETEAIILVIGACALDRLLHVKHYPKEDTKMLCQATFEYGGGNAANTASGLGLLSRWKPQQHEEQQQHQEQQQQQKRHSFIKVQLLTKIGNDDIQKRLCHELHQCNVNLSSPLFIINTQGGVIDAKNTTDIDIGINIDMTNNNDYCTLSQSKQSTTPIATIIVSSNNNDTNDNNYTNHNSRTCFFDKGTCGTLNANDVFHKIQNKWNHFFHNVALIHSDSRHTDAAALLVQEASNRGGVIISLDLERDRYSKSFDQLVDYANIIFISENQNQLQSILERRDKLQSNTSKNDIYHQLLSFNAADACTDDVSQKQYYKYYKDIIVMYFSLIKSAQNNQSRSLDMIITRGHLGALQCTLKKYKNISKTKTSEHEYPKIISNKISIDTNHNVKGILHFKQSIAFTNMEKDCIMIHNEEYEYEIHIIGPPHLKGKVVDSTGAGDAFIAGYLWSTIILSTVDNNNNLDFDTTAFKLKMASWVAGKKLLGPGARSTLPTSEEIDIELGSDIQSIVISLDKKVKDAIF